MANATASRLGQANLGGATDALFLKKFAGEILTMFEQTTVLLDKHLVKTIENGKSASFPLTGTVTGGYHTPGSEIVGQAVAHNEKVIAIDGLLYSDAFIANIDEAMNHYDSRKPYTDQMGAYMSNTFDQNVILEGILGARSAALITGGQGGAQITNDKFKYTGSAPGATTVAEKAQALTAALFAAAQTMDEKKVPSTSTRYCLLRPSEYYTLIQDTNAINRDWDGDGSLSKGRITEVAGIQVLKSNNLPKTDLSARAYHGANCAKTMGLIFTPEAIATIKLMDLKLQSEWDIRRQGTLFVATYAMGHGFLRPECLIELNLNTLTA